MNAAAFEAQLATRDAVPILVLRLPDIERIAWRSGRRAARQFERHALAAFVAGARHVLRADDLISHEPASDTFAAALRALPRHRNRAGDAPEPRAAIARIGAALEADLRCDVLTGWTLYDAQRDGSDFNRVFARALEHGARERERYAFFALLGHELRTPLASIRGYLETMLADDLEPTVRRRFTRVAFRESLRLSRLIDGLFEISLFDSSSVDRREGHASLVDVLAAVGDATSSAARVAGATVVFAGGNDAEIAIDADRLTLVLVNLVENAIKHGRPSGQVVVRAFPRDATVAIAVDDDGRGVAEPDRQRIFALGGRGESRASGNGIGLALVRLLVERNGGSIAVATSPQGGARFTVMFPRGDAQTLAQNAGAADNSQHGAADDDHDGHVAAYARS